MGLKGISWFEQNVEKVAVGVFGVALLGVVAMQFVGKGNEVQLSSGREKRAYAFDDVWGAVRDTASATHARITSAEPDGEVLGYEAGPGVLESFNSGLRGAVSPNPTLAAPLDESVLAKLNLDVGGEGRGNAVETYAALNAPAPAQPTGAVYLATLHPQEVLRNEDLLKMVAGDMKVDAGANGTAGANTAERVSALLPRLDRAGVSVETTYDGTALEEALMADPDGSGPLAVLPRHWWDSGRVQILAVQLERQELNAAGEWSAAAPVAKMPGRLDLLESVEQMQAGEGVKLTDILQEASRSRQDVLRPAYYSIMLGDEWVPPTERIEELAAIPEGGDAEATVRRQLAELDSRIVAEEEKKAKLQAGSPTPGVQQGPRQPTPPPARGKLGGQPGGGNREPAATQDPKQVAIERIDNRIQNLWKMRQRVIDDAARRGIVLDAKEPANAAAPQDDRAAAETEAPLLTNPDVRVWAHDISVERGKTYRYRVSLVLNNPMYGKSAAMDPTQVSLAEQAVVMTPPSEWSEPVFVDPETYYFITGASPEDAFASSARASAEVFYFSMGFWRRGQVNLEPGDTIAAEVQVPDPQKVAAMLPMDFNQEQPEAANPPGRGIPPGVRGVQPGLRGVEPAARPDEGMVEPGAIDPATILVPRLVAEDAMLLDVATTTVVSDQGIAKTRTENQAFLLGEDGKIQVRTPDGDRSAVAYAKLVRSAQRGEEALRPRANIGGLKPPPDLRGPDPVNERGGGGAGGG